MVEMKIDRRNLLKLSGTVGIAALAGCTGQQANNNGDNNEENGSRGSGDGDGDGDGGGGGWVGTATIEMNDQLEFVPRRVSISRGDTVTWETVGSLGHTVTAYGDEIPGGADFFASGGYGSEQAARDAYSSDLGGNVVSGETYKHTFEVRGEYHYFCIPHEFNGMTGWIRVE